MVQQIERTAQPYYLAAPRAGLGSGVLVLHAWWGLNAFFKGFCDRLAEAGFVALAPDLYHGAIAETIEEAEALSSGLPREQAERQIAQAVEQLQIQTGSGPDGPGSPRLGVVGFSMGGYYALCLADAPSSPVEAVVVFYGTRAGDYRSNPAAYQFHFAELDDYETPSDIKAMKKSLKAAGREAEFYTYPGTTHWFFESDCLNAYQSQAAELAWERTVAFLNQRLSPASSRTPDRT